MSLLSKTRQLNTLLQKAAGKSVSFMEMSEVLRDIIHVNNYVVSRKGKILGYATASVLSDKMNQMVVTDGRFNEEYNDILLKIVETSTEPLFTIFTHNFITIVPLIGGGHRLGTLVLTRDEIPFMDDDLILAEYGATVIGMEILRERAEEVEALSRNKAIVEVAIGTLSFSELEAVEHIFEELKGKEGLLVASKIADRVGITRSVIVNAMRKLESAGVIETRSLGMKGTYIRVLNDYFTQGIVNSKA